MKLVYGLMKLCLAHSTAACRVNYPRGHHSADYPLQIFNNSLVLGRANSGTSLRLIMTRTDQRPRLFMAQAHPQEYIHVQTFGE